MHELSIALRILDIAGKKAKDERGTVVAVHLQLGPLSGVVKGALQAAYDLAREGTALSKARLVVEEIPLTVYCPSCLAERTLPSLQKFCCPDCGTSTAEVVHGRELQVAALEIES